MARDGKIPFSDWLRSLRDGRSRAIIRARLNRIRIGNLGDCRPVGEDISEIRIDFGPGFRLYFGQEGKAVVILLCGGSKGTQEKDIRQAKQYWQDYRSRKNEKE
jgi:putative addiction module killer protein